MSDASAKACFHYGCLFLYSFSRSFTEFSLFLALIVRFGLHGRLASFFFFYALSQPALVLGDR
jgi:hypothetical protein